MQVIRMKKSGNNVIFVDNKRKVSDVTIPISTKLYNYTLDCINDILNYEAKYTRDVLSGNEINDCLYMQTDFLLRDGLSYLTRYDEHRVEVRKAVEDDRLKEIASSYVLETCTIDDEDYLVLISKNYALDIVIYEYNDLKKYAYKIVNELEKNDLCEVVEKDLNLRIIVE